MQKFAIAVVVTSRSNSFEYSISVHAVHAGAERNVCYIVVSILKHPQTSTNPSQTLLPVYKLAHLPLPHPKSSSPRPTQPLAQPFAQMRYRCKYQVSSTGPNILEEYRPKSYLHGIALPDFYTVSSFFYKKIKTNESTYLGLSFP